MKLSKFQNTLRRKLQGSREVNNKSIEKISYKGILVMFALGFSFLGNLAFASDNVLQAIQINGNKDTYDIVLKSDDSAELHKTIQAPNKMVLHLKGIRASKSINTIYSNTASVDSVVVEPINNETVKILIQADNVGNANVSFDTLKTPLGLLGGSLQTTTGKQIELSKPMNTYKSVYEEGLDENSESFLSGLSSSTLGRYIKKALKSSHLSWMIAFGLFTIIVMGGIKNLKGQDNTIKVGLSQSLRERELESYRGLSSTEENLNHLPLPSIAPQMAGANYGLKAYQSGTRSPYMTHDIQRPAARPTITPTKVPVGAGLKTSQTTAQSRTISNTRPKASNIDSVKFLESMTKIYEKNGRSDLAQGLKTNMKKAGVMG